MYRPYFAGSICFFAILSHSFGIRVPEPWRRCDDGFSEKNANYFQVVETTATSTETDEIQSSSSGINSFWPPWPFNLIHEKLRHKQQQSQSSDGTTTTTPGRSLFPFRKNASSSSSSIQQRRVPPTILSSAWSLSQQSLRIATRNFQELSSHVWFHLPPAAPPLLLLAFRRNEESRRLPILIHNAFCRQCALAGLTAALLSWGHTQWYRQRRLTPLRWTAEEIRRAVLPPILPPRVDAGVWMVDDVTSSTITSKRWNHVLPSPIKRYWQSSATTESSEEQEDTMPKNADTITTTSSSSSSSHLRRSPWSNWYRSWMYQRATRANARRQAVYDQLVGWQKKQKRAILPPSGWAVVTGASQGIGRALALELARWKIPLVLVARNLEALQAVAEDIEACYGVPCRVLVADLSKPTAAEQLYSTLQSAGLEVDVCCCDAKQLLRVKLWMSCFWWNKKGPQRFVLMLFRFSSCRFW